MQGDSGWGNVRFRPARMRGAVGWGGAEGRFVTGLVVFVLTALLYPWYAYKVQAWLLARELEAAAEVMEREARADQARLRRQAAALGNAQAADAPYAAPASIRIMGAMELRNGPMAIVDLAGRPLDEVTPIICLRVQETLGTPTVGREIRVQRWRRDAPAVSMGVVRC